ncbi:PepSY-like domain-containing protein [Pontibacter sp. H249]|uniref:PepSY-like domain-containing protein n=1 Tax=Pontibacter sp. H249 TaxID=3133420 RepID=UPI0030BB9F0F
MKRIAVSVLTASFSSLFLLSCVSQSVPQNKVPSVVVNALSSNYANAANVEWEKVEDTYEAEFEVDSKEYTVQLSTAGNVMQTKYDVAETELPEAIKNTISSKYQSYKLDDIELLEKGGQQYYQVELEGQTEDKNLVLDNSGNEQTAIAYWD